MSKISKMSKKFEGYNPNFEQVLDRFNNPQLHREIKNISKCIKLFGYNKKFDTIIEKIEWFNQMKREINQVITINEQLQYLSPNDRIKAYDQKKIPMEFYEFLTDEFKVPANKKICEPTNSLKWSPKKSIFSYEKLIRKIMQNDMTDKAYESYKVFILNQEWSKKWIQTPNEFGIASSDSVILLFEYTMEWYKNVRKVTYYKSVYCIINSYLMTDLIKIIEKYL